MSDEAPPAPEVPVRPAATVIVLREAPAGPEVLMLRRQHRSGFMPSVWVFPGGAVEPSDAEVGARVRGGDQAAVATGLGPEARGWLTGGVRETFEEAGVWLGDGALPAEARQPLRNGDVSLDALLDAHDATLDLDRLTPWSRWVTPTGGRRRYDALFLLAEAPPGTPAVADRQETIDARWLRPAEILDAGPGALPLAPPTWWTVKELAEAGTVQAARAAVRDLSPTQPMPEGQDPQLGWPVAGPYPQVPRYIRWTDDGWRCTRGA